MTVLSDQSLSDSAAAAADHDTIFALSSGAPPAGIAVIRISGPEVGRAAQVLLGAIPPARLATLVAVRDAESKEVIDRGLALFFPGPASFTGEDVLELQVHGGRAVIAAILGTLGNLAGFRLAEPGEFTRRAFHAGRMDLTEAEGLGDLIAAETAMQRHLALGQMQGSIRNQYESWRGRLVRIRGLIEAELDFSDEEGVSGSWVAMGRPALEEMLAAMMMAIADADRGRALRDGAEIVIMGAVNAGKSSLLNALARREVAIVSPEAGTTRDMIEVPLDLGGYRVVLIDTAGLREAEGAVEQEGIRRARQRGLGADLVLWLFDSADLAVPAVEAGAPLWRVATKRDIWPEQGGPEADYAISARTGDGLDALLAGIGQFLRDRLGTGEDAVVTRLRHAEALESAADAIGLALAARSGELAAENLRIAGDALGRVTGRIDVEEVLDVVFREFCIGK